MVDVLTNPKIWLLILVLSAIGSLARLPNYYLGAYGRERIETIYPRIKNETWENALQWYRHLGPLPLLIASIPVIGTVLTVASGMAGVSRAGFIFWVIISKTIRNWIIFLVFFNLI